MKKVWAVAALALVFIGCNDSDNKDKDKCENDQVICNGTCRKPCPSNYEYDANCECKPVCTSTQVICGGKCVNKCPGNAAMKADCTCPKLDACEDPNQERCINEEGAAACYAYCGAGTDGRNDDCSCHCIESDKVYCGDSCVDGCSEASGASLDENCKCKCPNDGVYWGGQCKPKCDATMERDPKTGDCRCPDSEHYRIEGNRCVKCFDGATVKGGKCECGNPLKYCAGANAGAGKCQERVDDPEECPSGATYNTANCQCECNSGTPFLCGGTCVAQPTKECDPETEYTCKDYDANTHWMDEDEKARCVMDTCNLTIDGTDCEVDTSNHCGADDAQCQYSADAEEPIPCYIAKNDPDNEKGWIGEVSCTDKCLYNSDQVAACTLCGNGNKDEGEECDVEDTNQQTSSLDWKLCSEYDSSAYKADGNKVKCDKCQTVDTTACSPKVECGDGEIASGIEVCDVQSADQPTSALDWKSCSDYDADTYKADGSMVKCDKCQTVDVSACKPIAVCGDGETTTGREVCDVKSADQATSALDWMKCSAYKPDVYEDDGSMVQCDKCQAIIETDCHEKKTGIYECYFEPASITLSGETTSADVTVHFKIADDVNTDNLTTQVGVISMVSFSNYSKDWIDAEFDCQQNGICSGTGAITTSHLVSGAMRSMYIGRILYSGKSYYCLNANSDKKPKEVDKVEDLISYMLNFGTIN